MGLHHITTGMSFAPRNIEHQSFRRETRSDVQATQEQSQEGITY